MPAGLKSLAVGNASLDGVTLPAGLQTLIFGYHFSQSLKGINLPAGLQTLTFGSLFNKVFDGFDMPAGLQDLTLGNKSLGAALPAGLR